VFTPHLKTRARLVAIGGAWGFLAGVLVATAVVWRSQRDDTWLSAGVRAAAERLQVAEHLDPAPVDDHSPVLEAKTVGTAGGEGEEKDAKPALSPPPAAELEDRDLLIPVEGYSPDRLVSSFDDPRGSRKHEAIDILAPRGTAVRAVEGGRIARLFFSKAGGITIYQFDPTERYCYYYAHLERYANGLQEQDRVRKGQVIGYVGTSGNAPKDTPHLHFAIFRLTDEKRWWEGTPLDPYEILR
jgi:murein DD-endopeptidase MepM/ murein hydrolase activator NlpD